MLLKKSAAAAEAENRQRRRRQEFPVVYRADLLKAGSQHPARIILLHLRVPPAYVGFVVIIQKTDTLQAAVPSLLRPRR